MRLYLFIGTLRRHTVNGAQENLYTILPHRHAETNLPSSKNCTTKTAPASTSSHRIHVVPYCIAYFTPSRRYFNWTHTTGGILRPRSYPASVRRTLTHAQGRSFLRSCDFKNVAGDHTTGGSRRRPYPPRAGAELQTLQESDRLSVGRLLQDGAMYSTHVRQVFGSIW